MSSSNVGKSFGGAGGKEGITDMGQGKPIPIKEPVITFEDMKSEYKEYCIKLAIESVCTIHLPRSKLQVFQEHGRVHKDEVGREI